MGKNKLIILFSLVLSFNCYAQQQQSVSLEHLKGDGKEYQLYLEKPATCIQSIHYEDGTQIDGKLSMDGMRIFIANYTNNQMIFATLNFKNGEVENISRGPCYIVPRSPL